MKRLAMSGGATAATLVPAAALAADGQGSPSLFMLTLQMVAALAVVLGLIYLFYHLSNRWLKLGAPMGGGERHIRLVETRHLAPKKSLVLVEVGGEYLLLGSSSDNLTFLKQIDILEEIEVIDDPEKQSTMAALFQGKLDAMAAKIAAIKQGRADSPSRRAEKF
ncbi:flagellar biosynthetic protein FliO [Geobacter hydrogenophilus]|uniref:Flagellar protein n=1 Tax=Geobacter hydrogenophilus TaxID=40983 RepID=A0A9W6FZB1_9BACT|nr:flagellar biosynthetic protein FliO [Geobacter hydrogenophilus]GLI37600.1 flagellar protein [Geobacter hydrogenophilus]